MPRMVGKTWRVRLASSAEADVQDGAAAVLDVPAAARVVQQQLGIRGRA